MIANITWNFHYSDVIMSVMASQITSLTIVSSTIYSGTDQRKQQSYTSLAFVWGIHRGPVNSPHKRPVTRKISPFDDVIMSLQQCLCGLTSKWGVLFNIMTTNLCTLHHTIPAGQYNQWYPPCWARVQPIPIFHTIISIFHPHSLPVTLRISRSDAVVMT